MLDQRSWESDLDRLFALKLVRLPSRAQRRYAFQSPFLVGYPREQLVAVLGERPLPTLFMLFPFDPSGRSSGSDLVEITLFAGKLLFDSLAIYEGSFRRDG